MIYNPFRGELTFLPDKSYMIDDSFSATFISFIPVVASKTASTTMSFEGIIEGIFVHPLNTNPSFSGIVILNSAAF